MDQSSSIGLWLVLLWTKFALFGFQQGVQFTHKLTELLLVLLFLNAFAEKIHALDFFGSHLALRFFTEVNSLPTKTHCSRCFRRGELYLPPILESPPALPHTLQYLDPRHHATICAEGYS